MKKLSTPFIALSLAVLAGCGQPATTTGAAPSQQPSETVSAVPKEVTALPTRIVLAHDGGLTTLDADSGEIITTTKLDGFLRLNNAGDGRHVLVSAGDEFKVFDSGLITQGHDDHSHYYVSEPTLTSVSYPAPKAGHVVAHSGVTALFADGDGSIQLIQSEKIADSNAVVRTAKTDDPHHGVALQLADSSLFLTQGTTESRSVVQVRKGDKVAAETKDCPGSHGEATAAPTESGDVVVMGCTNGPVVFRDGAFHKVPVQDAYARSGNLAGHESSSIVLGDYKVDKNAKPVERPTRVSLIDTRSDQLKLVELGSSYWFRSLGRGPAGEGLVLTYDGKLNVIDVDQGKVTQSIAAITPWQEKDEWQQPGPILKVAGDNAYITDAERKELVVVNLKTATVSKKIALTIAPVEMAVVSGQRAS